MLSDLVIDTNVLLHASNRIETRRDEAHDFLHRLLHDTETELCLDEGFHAKEAQNRSHIYSEYLERLPHGSFGEAVIIALAQQGRVKEISKTASQQIRNAICQVVPKKRDRLFVRVTYNSIEKVLASHDFKDFPNRTRNTLRSDLGVNICTACEASEHLD